MARTFDDTGDGVAGTVPLSQSPWSEARIEQLTGLWLAGYPASAIAAEMALSRNAVISKVHRLGLKRNGGPVRTKASYRRQARTSGRGASERSIPGAPPPKMLSLMQLEADSCRYAYGDPRKAGFGFCGHPVRPGSSFCPPHHAACTLPPAEEDWDTILAGILAPTPKRKGPF